MAEIISMSKGRERSMSETSAARAAPGEGTQKRAARAREAAPTKRTCAGKSRSCTSSIWYLDILVILVRVPRQISLTKMIAPSLFRENEERVLHESYWKQRAQELELENLQLTRLSGKTSLA